MDKIYIPARYNYIVIFLTQSCNLMLYDNPIPAYHKIFGDILRRLDRCDDAEILYEQSSMLEAAVSELNN